MKKFYTALLLVFAIISGNSLFAQNNNVGIGTTTPDASAVLDVTSSTQGVLVPRMTTALRTAIANPAQGLLVYDTDLGCFYYRNATQWISLCQAGPVGPQGPQGVTGANGSQGPAGVNGVNGATGTNGATGATGANGITGATGATGSQGATGANGATGASGADGATGATGANG